MELLKIRAFEDDDLLLMKAWLNKGYVIKWYEDPGEWLAEIRGRFDEFSFIHHFIALYGDKPIGFCQYYACADAGESWYGDIPLAGSYSIDYLIGEEDYLAKGLGKAIIGLLVQEIFSLNDALRIIVLPDSQNTASCKSLLANGFTLYEKNKLYCRTK